MRIGNGALGAVAMCFAIGGMQEAAAHSLTHNDVLDVPALVMLIDGKDRNDSVTLRYDVPRYHGGSAHGKSGKHRKDSKNTSEYVFGYFDASGFSPLTGKKGRLDFAGGSVVDFAIAGKGTDGIFGTGDDVYYRLSDPEDYADLYFRRPVRHGKSRTPAVDENYFGKLMIAWDTDQDGKTDFMAQLKTGNRYDGMALTAVPIPAAGLLFASGLVGLGMFGRRRKLKKR